MKTLKTLAKVMGVAVGGLVASAVLIGDCCFCRPRENDNVVNFPLTTLSFAHYHGAAS